MTNIPLSLLNIEDDVKLPYSQNISDSVEEFNYNPETQTSNILCMGDTSPTTRSQTNSTALGNDGDESSDDTGSD